MNNQITRLDRLVTFETEQSGVLDSEIEAAIKEYIHRGGDPDTAFHYCTFLGDDYSKKFIRILVVRKPERIQVTIPILESGEAWEYFAKLNPHIEIDYLSLLSSYVGDDFEHNRATVTAKFKLKETNFKSDETPQNK